MYIVTRKQDISIKSMSLYNSLKGAMSNMICPCSIPIESKLIISEKVSYKAWIVILDNATEISVLHKDDIATIEKIDE